MKELKIVCIGGFGHAVCVLDELPALSNARLIAAAAAYPGENLDIIKNHKNTPDELATFDDYKKMLAQLSADVAIVSTRLDCIAPASIYAAGKGCHLICEKPLALNHRHLRQLHKIVTEKKSALMAMLTMRSEPAFIAARDLYRQGTIGTVVLANGRKSYKWLTRPDWFADAHKYGDTIGWVGIHALDIINYITDLDFTAVAACQSNFAHPQHPGCQDNCALILQMSNAGHATVSVDYFRPHNAPTHGDDWVRIVGTKGIIEANASLGTCQVIAEDTAPHQIQLPPKRPIFKQFMQNIINAKPSRASRHAQAAFKLTDACLRAGQAAKTGAITKIDPENWQL